MERLFSKEMPVKVERVRNGFVLNYDVQETPEEEIQRQWRLHRGGVEGEDAGLPDVSFVSEYKYMYYSVRIPMGQWNYGGIVSMIVRSRYTTDEMEAITNNMAAVNAAFMQTLVTGGIVEAIGYLKESADDENSAIFQEMQEWRALAKSEAKRVLNME